MAINFKLHHYRTVFEISASGQEEVLHSFEGPPNDGATPYGRLIFDAKGNLYGTTQAGGDNNGPNGICRGGNNLSGCGTVFKLSAARTETVLWNFGQPGDGIGPYAGLIFDQKGNLYGTTEAGGIGVSENFGGWGTVFELTATGKEQVLYAFGGPPDGCSPVGGLVFDAQGNLYGTTAYCGAYSYGTVFKITP